MKGLRIFNGLLFAFACLLGLDGLAGHSGTTTVFQQLVATVQLCAGALLVCGCLAVEVAVQIAEAAAESNRLLTACRIELVKLIDHQRTALQLAERQTEALERLKRSAPVAK